jgi:hypothetical protein
MRIKAVLGVVIALLVLYIGAKTYAGRVAEKRVKEAVTRVAPFADVAYRKVGVDFLPPQVRISDVTVTPRAANNTYRIAEIVLKDGDRKSGIPAYLSFACRGVELNLEDHYPRMKSDLGEMGYTPPLLMSLDVDYRYEREAKELRVNRLSVGVDDAGRIECSATLSNLSLDPAGLLMLPLSYSTILLREAKLTYKDDSLFDRVMKLQAHAEKKDPKEWRKRLVEGLQKDIDHEKDEFRNNAMKQIKKFVERPGRLSLTVSPAKPVSVGEIMRYGVSKEAVGALNVRIKAD